MHWSQEIEQLKTRGRSPSDRPFVTAAFAMSCDGYLSAQRGHSTSLSGPQALCVTHQLRATHDALVVGVGTVLSDDPLLTTRLVEGPSPLRVVLDSHLRVPATARLLRSTQRPPCLVTTARACSCSPHARELEAAGADLVCVAESGEGVSLPDALARLAERGVRSVMLEGGARVLESFFRAECVDYIALTVSPQPLANPDAVPVGRCTSEVLARWCASYSTHVGDDRLALGVAPCARRALGAA